MKDNGTDVASISSRWSRQEFMACVSVLPSELHGVIFVVAMSVGWCGLIQCNVLHSIVSLCLFITTVTGKFGFGHDIHDNNVATGFCIRFNQKRIQKYYVHYHTLHYYFLIINKKKVLKIPFDDRVQNGSSCRQKTKRHHQRAKYCKNFSDQLEWVEWLTLKLRKNTTNHGQKNKHSIYARTRSHKKQEQHRHQGRPIPASRATRTERLLGHDALVQCPPSNWHMYVLPHQSHVDAFVVGISSVYNIRHIRSLTDSYIAVLKCDKTWSKASQGSWGGIE